MLLSRTYIPNQQQLYRLNLKDYTRIRTWLQSSKHNYTQQSQLSTIYEYYPIYYIMTFKKISISENFLHKNLRIFNLAINNGFKIMAGIYDDKKNMYIAKIYQKKGIFCNVDVFGRVINILDQIVLGFYVLDSKVKVRGKLQDGFNLKNMFVMIQLVLTSSDGQTFNIGFAKHSLADRTKLAVIDLQIFKVGEKQQIGFIQLHIDSPPNLGLAYFIPPYTFIDPSTRISPYKTLELKNKIPTNPMYTLLPMYNITLFGLQITINNNDKLIKILQRCSPYYTNYHLSNIKMEILKIQLIIGWHNSWQIISQLPARARIDKDKDREKSSPKHINHKNKGGHLHTENKQGKKNALSLPYNNIFNCINLNKVTEDPNSIILHPQSAIKTQSLFILDGPQLKKQNLNNINLLYFESENAQLVAILQYTLKYKLDSTIKEQKIQKTNIFWAPITFNIAQPKCQVKIPMIQHIALPGYPIQWNNIQKNHQISTQLNYKIINQNAELHRNARKQRIHSHANKRQYISSQKQNSHKTYMQMLMQEDNMNNIADNLLKSIETRQRNITKNSVDSLLLKQQQTDQSIQSMLRKLQRNLKPKIKLSDNKITNQIIQYKNLEQKQINKTSSLSLSLIGKSFTLKLRLRQYLPCTNNPTQYYIPRKMLLKFFIFRQTFQHVVLINKQSTKVKSGIPIQLQNPTKFDYEGFTFNVQINDIKAWEAGGFEDSNNFIISVWDQENKLYYGDGVYPTLAFFQKFYQISNKNKEVMNVQNNQEVFNYFKVGLRQNCNNFQHLRGFLLFQYLLRENKHEKKQHANPTEVKLTKIMRNIPTKQRQMLRIQNFNGNPQAPQKQLQLIQQYKQTTHNFYIQNLTTKQLNNDIQLSYQIGRITYNWIRFQNTDKSDNNIFHFYLECDFMQLITNRAQYLKESVRQYKEYDEDGEYVMEEQQKQLRNKKWVELAYILGKGGNNSYYEAKIPQGTRADLLVKVFNNQWSPFLPSVSITYLRILRNTLPYKTLKIRLNYIPPLIDNFHHITVPYTSSPNNQLKFKFPPQALQQSDQFINTLTLNTIYNNKQKTLIISKLNQNGISQTGTIFGVLIGIFYQKTCKQLKRVLYLQVQCLQGQKYRLQLGNLEIVKIPICGDDLLASDKIYRIQISNVLFARHQKIQNKLHYLSKTDKTQPQIQLQILQPIQNKLVISILSYQQKLLKKYLLDIQCTISPHCSLQKIQAQGYMGQKLIFIFHNPYHIDFGFYLTQTTKNIKLKQIEQQKKYEQQEIIFKIRAKMDIKILAQIIGDIRNNQYIVLNDCNNRVIQVYHLRVVTNMKNLSFNQYGKFQQSDYLRQHNIIKKDNNMSYQQPSFGAQISKRF